MTLFMSTLSNFQMRSWVSMMICSVYEATY